MTVKASVGACYANLFSRSAFVPFHRALFKVSLRGLGVLNYQSMHASGELGFLRREFQNRIKPLVLDVGAHKGEYARTVLSVNPGARIHSFEPHPKSFAELTRVPGLAGAHQTAVSARSGTMLLFDGVTTAGSQLATVVPGIFEDAYGQEAQSISVAVTTLDAFAEEQEIDKVDLLKLDVEGHELAVLGGAKRLLAERRIEWIQFEFGTPQLISGSSIYQFQQLLKDYTLYRLLSAGVIELDGLQRYEREVFAFQNIVGRLRPGL